MLPPAKRKELDALKQKLGEVRQLTADIHGVGHEVGGGLLQGRLTVGQLGAFRKLTRRV